MKFTLIPLSHILLYVSALNTHNGYLFDEIPQIFSLQFVS